MKIIQIIMYVYYYIFSIQVREFNNKYILLNESVTKYDKNQNKRDSE